VEIEQLVERLFNAFLEMKESFEQQNRPLGEQIVQTYLQYLKQMFAQKKISLADSFGEIDQKVLDCSVYIEEYRRLYAILNSLNEKLSQLGEAPLPMPEALPSDDIEKILSWRIQFLRSRGRL
jgi:hypothetical protein